MKNFRMAAAALLAVLMFSMPAFAGEWVWIDERPYYNTGWDYNLSEGWNWISDTGGTAYCYYIDKDGFALTNTRTPDGYQVNESGRWVDNGVEMTRPYDNQTMFIDTDYYKFGGDYYLEKIEEAGGRVYTLNTYDYPTSVTYSNAAETLTVHIYSNPDSFLYFRNFDTRFSYEAKYEGDNYKLDVIHEDYFRVIMENGDVYYFAR